MHNVTVTKSGVLIPKAAHAKVIAEDQYGVTTLGLPGAGVNYLALWDFETIRDRLDEQWDESRDWEVLKSHVWQNTSYASGRRISNKVLKHVEVEVGEDMAVLDHGDLLIVLKDAEVAKFYQSRTHPGRRAIIQQHESIDVKVRQ